MNWFTHVFSKLLNKFYMFIFRDTLHHFLELILLFNCSNSFLDCIRIITCEVFSNPHDFPIFFHPQMVFFIGVIRVIRIFILRLKLFKEWIFSKFFKLHVCHLLKVRIGYMMGRNFHNTHDLQGLYLTCETLGNWWEHFCDLFGLISSCFWVLYAFQTKYQLVKRQWIFRIQLL
jgi:hypothetical protein